MMSGIELPVEVIDSLLMSILKSVYDEHIMDVELREVAEASLTLIKWYSIEEDYDEFVKHRIVYSESKGAEDDTGTP